jgi:hypothetical protein
LTDLAMRPPGSKAHQSFHHAPSGAWLLSTMKAAGSRQQSLEISLSRSGTRSPAGP